MRLSIDGPGKQVSIDDSAVGREECGKVRAHTKNLLASGGELSNRGNSIMREVTTEVRSELQAIANVHASTTY